MKHILRNKLALLHMALWYLPWSEKVDSLLTPEFPKDPCISPRPSLASGESPCLVGFASLLY